MHSILTSGGTTHSHRTNPTDSRRQMALQFKIPKMNRAKQPQLTGQGSKVDCETSSDQHIPWPKYLKQFTNQ